MASRTVYHVGGFDGTKPASNRAEVWDSATGYTRWSVSGSVLTQRALSADEASALAEQDRGVALAANDTNIRQLAADALATNRTYVALTAPTAAQSTAQMKALTRQMNGLIRLMLGQLDGTD